MSDEDKLSYLYEPEGTELHWDGLKTAMPRATQASLSGPTPQYATHHTERQGLAGTQMATTRVLPPGTKASAPQAHNKPMTHEQLMAKARQMMDAQNQQKEAQLAQDAMHARDEAGAMLPAWLVKQGY